jgi:hypothetical protein
MKRFVRLGLACANLIVVLALVVLAMGGCKRQPTATPETRAIREKVAIDTRDNSMIYDSALLLGYSDDHTTETYRLDAATGSLELDGSITASTYISMAGWTFTDPSTISSTLAVTGRTTTAGLTSSAVITGTTAAFSGALSASAVTAGTFLVLTPATAITVTSAPFTPLGSYQPIAAAAWATPTIAALPAGTVLRLINTGTANITIADAAAAKLAATIVLGQYDSLALLSDGANWVQVASSDN